MKENIIQIVREMQANELQGRELEEKEFFVLQELCGTDSQNDCRAILSALGTSGTILAVPILCALLKSEDKENEPLLKTSIALIHERAKQMGSRLPDVFYTPAHWQRTWRGSINSFLSYVQVISDVYIRYGRDQSELDRIGAILAEEMNIDLSPYQTFADFRLCQSSWNFEKDYQVVLDTMAQEQALAEAEDLGLDQSTESLITDSLMDLQCDYLVARLKLKGNLEYFRFILKIAECLNTAEKE